MHPKEWSYKKGGISTAGNIMEMPQLLHKNVVLGEGATSEVQGHLFCKDGDQVVNCKYLKCLLSRNRVNYIYM